jgi:uncharacterized protein with PQ loop repeat
MFTQTLALAAAVLGVVQSLTLLGQARTLRRIGSAREVSLPFLSLAVLCSIAWLLYGTLHGDAALVAVNSVGLTGAATTLITALRLRAADGAGTQPYPQVEQATDKLTTARRLSPRQPAWLGQLRCDRTRRPRRPAAAQTMAEDEPRGSEFAVALSS